MTRRRFLFLLAPVLLVVCASCSTEPRSAAASVENPPLEPAAPGDHATGAHGDHTPHHGGTVYMNGDLHFEVVLRRDGTHRLYFSDAARAELPAATASDVTLTFSSGESAGSILSGEVDGSGESWIIKGSPPAGASITARVAFVANGEPYWIDVPYIDAADPAGSKTTAGE